jgi:hypothetical protein
MSVEYKIYIGDIPLIKVDCVSDITGATSTQINYQKPSGATGYWAATVVDGRYLQYQTQTNDLDEAGTWKFQAYLTLGGWIGHGETATQTIYALFA